MSYKSRLYVCGHTIVLTAFVQKTVLPTLSCLCTFIKNQLFVYEFFPLIYLSTFKPKPTVLISVAYKFWSQVALVLQLCSFIIFSFLNYCLFYFVFAVLGPLYFCMRFIISFSISKKKKPNSSFERYDAECINQFRENWHLTTIECFDPWTHYMSPLL